MITLWSGPGCRERGLLRSIQDRTRWRKIVHEAVNPRIEEDRTTTAITVFLQFFLSILLFQDAPSLRDHSTDMPPVPVGSRSSASQFDAMRKHCLCCRPVPVRPSVRHVGVLYPQDWRYRLNFFLSLVAHHSSFFLPQRRYQIPKGTLQRGRKIHGGGKVCDFRSKSPLTSKRYEIGPWLLWNVNSKS